MTCILISSEFDAAKSEVLEVVTDAVYLDHGDRLAIAGLGCPDVFADGGNGGLSGGADCGGIAGEGVSNGCLSFDGSCHSLFWFGLVCWEKAVSDVHFVFFGLVWFVEKRRGD